MFRCFSECSGWITRNTEGGCVCAIRTENALGTTESIPEHKPTSRDESGAFSALDCFPVSRQYVQNRSGFPEAGFWTANLLAVLRVIKQPHVVCDQQIHGCWPSTQLPQEHGYLAAMVGLVIDEMHKHQPKRISPCFTAKVRVADIPRQVFIMQTSDVLSDALLDGSPAFCDRL